MTSFDDMLDQPIAVLGLPNRVWNALDARKIRTVEELLNCCSGLVSCDRCRRGPEECDAKATLAAISGLGTLSVMRIYEALREKGVIR